MLARPAIQPPLQPVAEPGKQRAKTFEPSEGSARCWILIRHFTLRTSRASCAASLGWGAEVAASPAVTGANSQD